METTLTQKQDYFVGCIKEGYNIFLTGKAGTGKSFAIKEAMDVLKKMGKKYVAVAPTGVAANNVKGQTIHSLFSIKPFGVADFESCNWLNSEKRRILEKVDVIFVDEVSMLRPDVLDAMNWTLLKSKCKGLKDKQIIFVGDLKQLPPVLDQNTRSVLEYTYKGYEFYNAKIYEKLEVKTIELDEVLRQSDNEFIDNLNIIREGKKSEYFRRFVSDNPTGIVLAPHNATVKKYNEEGLSKIDSKEIVFTAEVEGKITFNDFNVEPEVTVKHGAKIMYLKNSKNNNLFNGAIGEFVDKNGQYFIKIGGVEYSIKQEEFNKKEYVYDELTDSLKLRTVKKVVILRVL
jgi:ATP-dependent exoDNAse (exonuclease V) alpha subunit